ncbi:MAG: endonuclease/exonuclease/phosphatase family protein [Myxococcales bacterium]|nr:endonuclease/exonuclease/phosphatase family protein [Myxococcales bacterium]
MTRGTFGLIAASLATGVALLAPSCAHPTRAARPPHPGERHLRVATYNVNFGIPGDEATLAAIEATEAELVLLQETTPAWEAFLRSRFRNRYPRMAFRHCCGAGGLAVLSRYPFAEGHLEGPKEGWFPAQRLVVKTPLGLVQVLNVHLRPPASDSGSYLSGYFTTPKVREAEIALFHRQLDPNLPTLVVGDFNEDHGGRAVRYLRARGFATALAEFQPGRHTWRWPTSVGTLSHQLDHLAYDRSLVPLEAEVLEAGNSDHLPVIGVFALAEPGR